jgi:rhodanese-related sulfurtransferase
MASPRSAPLRRGVAGIAGVAVLVLGVGSLAGCGDDAAGSTAVTETSAEADPGVEAATVALEEERAAIDVRTPEEYAEGHVEGAANLDIRDAGFPEAIADLDPDGSYVVYCRTGNRSAQAATEMRALGLEVIDGGALTDMESAGWPIV